jgi:RNA-splicing ligase RtcB
MNMLELKGKYNFAKVFTDTTPKEAISQITTLLNQPFVQDSTICIMPDVHVGAGCTIGTTMTITDKVVPNLVGVDIGCGIETVLLKNSHVELQRLDHIINKYIPAGFNIRGTAHPFSDEIDWNDLRCANHVNKNRAALSIGTLGGGNHFIELDKDDDDRLYLVVHSGSRNLGKQVCEYYQKTAFSYLEELQKNKTEKIDKNLAYAEGQLFADYIHDMKITQRYAMLNRKAIVKEIMKQMKLKSEESFSTIHNYIDLEVMILRKGAISAMAGEQVLIPINMRDGSLICIGKGNPDWNYSAPHGAGRLMSRSVAKEEITLRQFKESMKGIYSNSISKSTVDEAPFAYKPMSEITANISDTVDIIKIIKPIYNFKAAQ